MAAPPQRHTEITLAADAFRMRKHHFFGSRGQQEMHCNCLDPMRVRISHDLDGRVFIRDPVFNNEFEVFFTIEAYLTWTMGQKEDETKMSS